jgi:serine/threonine protein phosphatase 1
LNLPDRLLECEIFDTLSALTGKSCFENITGIAGKYMKTFVIGDMHGAHKALLQCLGRAGFDRQADCLIVLGDVCDRHDEVRQCFDELLSLKNCVYIIGNHDLWFMDWAARGAQPEFWMAQGGAATMRSYAGTGVIQEHVDFLNRAKTYFELDGNLFVHGGFDPLVPLKDQGIEKLAWDRDLIQNARKKHLLGESCKFGNYKNIFLGHTPTLNYGSGEPLHMCNVWAMDTGASSSGKLTIMDVKTQAYWQSDPIPELYTCSEKSVPV